MKSRVDVTPPELGRAVGAYGTWLAAEAEAKIAEVGRHVDLAALTIESSNLSEEWRALQQKRLGDDAHLLGLLERIAPIQAQVIGSLSERAHSLEGAASSFLGLAQALSEQRAESVRSFLTQNGVDGQRVLARGYGKGYPIAGNETAEGRQLNRRVEVVILHPGDRPEDKIRPPAS